MALAAINVKRTKEVFLLMWVYVICDRNGHFAVWNASVKRFSNTFPAL